VKRVPKFNPLLVHWWTDYVNKCSVRAGSSKNNNPSKIYIKNGHVICIQCDYKAVVLFIIVMLTHCLLSRDCYLLAQIISI
jgi:hypothetical protein